LSVIMILLIVTHARGLAVRDFTSLASKISSAYI
jgi:hypothetical protein